MASTEAEGTLSHSTTIDTHKVIQILIETIAIVRVRSEENLDQLQWMTAAVLEDNAVWQSSAKRPPLSPFISGSHIHWQC